MKTIVFFTLNIIAFCSFGQTVTTDPAFPSPSQPVTITFDVTGTDFATKNLTDVWLWAWLDNGNGDVNAPTNVNPATSAQDAAKVTRSGSNPNLYSITITATTFFNRPAEEIGTVGVLLKGRDWANGKTADKFVTFSESFAVAFASPSSTHLFIDEGESIQIDVNTNEDAIIVLKAGANTIASSSGSVTAFSYTHVVTETEGSVTITAEADNGLETKTVSFTYVIRTATVSEARPVGIIDGINYSTDQTKVTLSFWAPGKSSAFVLGDFNDWTIDPQYQMKQDGEHFWLEITGLTPGTEYAFQYLVDETLKLADPYADKILDPDDQYIPDATYPDLKQFPDEARSDQWYFNRLAVLQTGQEPYAWEVTDFQKPGKEKLVIYELLVRDFFGSDERNYQNLIDTLGYFKRLGVNAIQFMPIMEFNGNESWGYNPAFMFAVDKYYGTKNKFKEFIDKCHQNGIAVILDIAMNHQDLPNPYVMMDFDFANGRPETDNKWFNVSATHPFNVFFDMNHESDYTKKYLDTVNHYWLNEYKVDGFRFDLSKGFTQINNPNDVNAWSSYDASRIALLKRMADKIWEHTPDAYVILEHLSVNSEEKELAEYRADEGRGMMLWGKMTEQYNQNTMGFPGNSDISGVYHESRGWTMPHLVGYMESHDEERLMVKNLSSGNVTPNYSVKNLNTSLARVRAASTLFFTIPGPKMLWQFGELGYDYSINYCPDGSINESCRVSPKPVRWDYREDANRSLLYDHIAELNSLRMKYKVFSGGTATFSAGALLTKQIILKSDPYTATPSGDDEMNAVVAANFDMVTNQVAISFPHDGTWYDYYSDGQPLQVTGNTASVSMAPGTSKLFTDLPVKPVPVVGVEENVESIISVYPNPVKNTLHISSEFSNAALCLYTNQGRKIIPQQTGENTWDVSMLPKGFYVVRVSLKNKVYRGKFVKE